jgi:hypothetical protein
MKSAQLLLVFLFVFLLGGCSRGTLTPLIEAARAGDAAGIRALTGAGVNPNEPAGVNGWTPLLHAVHKNQRASVAALLDAGADINGPAPDGTTPLMMASGYGYTAIVELLLERGAKTRLTNAKNENALDLAVTGTTDIDHFTLFQCQGSTVALLQRADPDLAAHAAAQMQQWVKTCRSTPSARSSRSDPRPWRDAHQRPAPAGTAGR